MKTSPKRLIIVGLLTAICCVPYVLAERKQRGIILVLLALYALMYGLYVVVGLFAKACNRWLDRRASRNG